MSRTASSKNTPGVLVQFIEPMLGAAAFLLLLAIVDRFGYSPLPLENYYGSILVSSLTFWAGIRLRDNAEPAPRWKVFQEIFCLSLGLNLLAQALLAYTYSTLMLDNLPFYVLVAGSLLASLFLTALWRWLHPSVRNPGVLLVGFDKTTALVADVLGDAVVGMVGPEGVVLPSAVPYLGSSDELGRRLETHRPGRLVVSAEEMENGAVLRELFGVQVQDVFVNSAAAAYEQTLERTSIHSLSPEEFVSSARLASDRQTLAFQSVCNNLAGLAALAVLLPVILFIVIAIRLTCGPGPAVESVECAGFQKIPFQLLRFRTSRKDGTPLGLGNALVALHLVNLPQFINVIRGEMGIFGPRPVRVEYAERMSGLVPFYSQMFAVKPGIVSWAGIHLREKNLQARMPDDWLRLEYDLYYIKQSSPLLDLEMFLRLLPGKSR